MAELWAEYNSVIILIAALVAAVILRSVPILSYPFRLFFTMIHELGHVFATRSTGGDVVGFSIAANGTGVAHRRGGDDVAVIPAGYVGVALFSATLMLLSGFPGLAPYSLIVLGVFLILLILLYGRSSCLTALVGLAFGTAFIALAWYTPPGWSVFWLNLLAIEGGLTSLDDLQALRWGARHGAWDDDDATKMARRMGCSPMFWASVWFVCSALSLGAAIWFTWFRGMFD